MKLFSVDIFAPRQRILGGSLRSRQIAARLKVVDDLPRGRFGGRSFRVDDDLGVLGRLIRGDHAGIGEELGHFANAADVFGPVLGAEAEIAIQAHTNVITVEAVSMFSLL